MPTILKAAGAICMLRVHSYIVRSTYPHGVSPKDPL
jgi:hypothetical protein